MTTALSRTKWQLGSYTSLPIHTLRVNKLIVFLQLTASGEYQTSYLFISFNNNRIAFISKKLSDDTSYSMMDSETTRLLLATKRS